MNDATLFYTIIGSSALALATYWIVQKVSYHKALARPFPDESRALLARHFPVYQKLSPALQKKFERLITQFLIEKQFVGCAGLSVTGEMRLIIAASACLLLLNRDAASYPSLKWIYIYPSEFVVRRSVADAMGVVSKQQRILLGESWQNGRVILAWNSVTEGIEDFADGHNVAIHEFAHQLDGETGATNGAPVLPSHAYKSWSRILGKEYQTLQKKAKRRKSSVIDHYGATNPAEFFAVATETFYEKPAIMAHEHPELFQELKAYYNVDPREWAVE